MVFASIECSSSHRTQAYAGEAKQPFSAHYQLYSVHQYVQQPAATANITVGTIGTDYVSPVFI